MPTSLARPRKSARQPATGNLAADDPNIPECVDGQWLIQRLVEAVERYVVLPPGAAVAVALWIVFTYTIDAFDIAPILAILSPVKGCGKTSLVLILRALVWKPQVASNISPSALFRLIEKEHPTLLIDEIDAQLSYRNEELRSILNAGHTRSAATIIRSVGSNGDYIPRVFDVYTAKVLAGIGKLPPTVQDRSISIPMRRKFPHESVERIRQDRVDQEFKDIRGFIKRWADDHPGLREADPEMPEGLSDRACDNWRALLAIADAIGGVWPTHARDAAVLLNHSPAIEEDRGTLVLADICQRLAQAPDTFLRTDVLLGHLNSLDERPWATYTYGEPLTPSGLAHLLQPFGITPKQRRQGNQVLRGYARHDFADTFSRYLPLPVPHPLKAATGATAATRHKNRRISESVAGVAGVAGVRRVRPALNGNGTLSLRDKNAYDGPAEELIERAAAARDSN